MGNITTKVTYLSRTSVLEGFWVLTQRQAVFPSRLRGSEPRSYMYSVLQGTRTATSSTPIRLSHAGPKDRSAHTNTSIWCPRAATKTGCRLQWRGCGTTIGIAMAFLPIRQSRTGRRQVPLRARTRRAVRRKTGRQFVAWLPSRGAACRAPIDRGVSALVRN